MHSNDYMKQELEESTDPIEKGEYREYIEENDLACLEPEDSLH